MCLCFEADAPSAPVVELEKTQLGETGMRGDAQCSALGDGKKAEEGKEDEGSEAAHLV